MTTKLQHILCIDDEEDILEVARICLETVASFQVTCCHSGSEAVEQLAAINPDLILLDVMMPQMDGPSTLNALQERGLITHIPVIFMTARVQPSEIARYLSLGASGVIAKPFDPMKITEQIKDLWEKFHER